MRVPRLATSRSSADAMCRTTTSPARMNASMERSPTMREAGSHRRTRGPCVRRFRGRRTGAAFVCGYDLAVRVEQRARVGQQQASADRGAGRREQECAERDQQRAREDASALAGTSREPAARPRPNGRSRRVTREADRRSALADSTSKSSVRRDADESLLASSARSSAARAAYSRHFAVPSGTPSCLARWTTERGSRGASRGDSVVGAQVLERGVDRRRIPEHRRRVGTLRLRRVVESDLPRPASPPQHVAAPVHDHLVEPGVELRAVPQSRQVTPGRDEDLLDDVGRIRLVAEDCRRSAERPARPGLNERLERRDIACRRPLDEITVEGGRRLGVPSCPHHRDDGKAVWVGSALPGALVFSRGPSAGDPSRPRPRGSGWR